MPLNSHTLAAHVALYGVKHAAVHFDCSLKTVYRHLKAVNKKPPATRKAERKQRLFAAHAEVIEADRHLRRLNEHSHNPDLVRELSRTLGAFSTLLNLLQIEKDSYL